MAPQHNFTTVDDPRSVLKVLASEAPAFPESFPQVKFTLPNSTAPKKIKKVGLEPRSPLFVRRAAAGACSFHVLFTTVAYRSAGGGAGTEP